MTLIDEAREKFSEVPDTTLRKCLLIVREDGFAFDSKIGGAKLLEQLIEDINVYGIQRLLDSLTMDTLLDVCTALRVGRLKVKGDEDLRQAQQFKLEEEITKKGWPKCLKKMKQKLLKSVCGELGIHEDQTLPDLRNQVEEELVLLGAEEFFNWMPVDLLADFANCVGADESGDKTDLVESIMITCFDLAPLKEAESAHELEVSKGKKGRKGVKSAKDSDEDEQEDEDEDEDGNEEEEDESDSDSGRGESKRSKSDDVEDEDMEDNGEEEEEEEEEEKDVDEKGRPRIRPGITTADLNKYTVSELRAFVKESDAFSDEDRGAVWKLKKIGIIDFILVKLEDSADDGGARGKSRKRGAEDDGTGGRGKRARKQ